MIQTIKTKITIYCEINYQNSVKRTYINIIHLFTNYFI